MSDDLKSAWEVALEKLEAAGADSVKKLTSKQKAAIAEVRAKFRARIAEKEISFQDSLKGAANSGDADRIRTLSGQLAEERRRLEREMESQVQKIRNSDED